MIIIVFMTLAVLFGGLVLLCLFLGVKYEKRHHVGELNEDMDKIEQLMQIDTPTEESNSKENL